MLAGRHDNLHSLHSGMFTTAWYQYGACTSQVTVGSYVS
jgi:hypothetical protein